MASFSFVGSNKSIQSGFTLIELITVIILLGVISSIALPRFFNTSAYKARFAVDDLRIALQLAQKTAVSSGCTTQVNITSSLYQVWTDSNCGTGVADFTTPLQHPSDSGQYQLSFPDSVSITSPATPFLLQFQSDGRIEYNNVAINTALNLQINQDGTARSISLNGSTGFVE